jgi:hydrogenase maturation protein HypF
MKEWQKPIVATSGNLSGSPIFFEDEKAIKNLGTYADAFLTNDRDILIPQDDSVVQFSPKYQKRIVLRRSRGYAPTFIYGSLLKENKDVLAMGADMKSAFALNHAGNIYISQYLGDLESFDTQENYDLTLKHLLNLLGSKPAKVMTDLHPGYFSGSKGKEYAKNWEVEVKAFQHHKAHFGAVLAENNLIESKEPILGVIWDGLGWGDDGEKGSIWGGEFFTYSNFLMERSAYFSYFPFLMGDKMSREPRLSALSICHDLPESEAVLRPLFNESEWNIYQKMLLQRQKWLTCSVGRIFDAVAAVLGVQSVSSFEGEAAMHLEALACRYEKKEENRIKSLISPSLNPRDLLRQVIELVNARREKDEIAFHFHLALAELVHAIAEQKNIKKIAFSGGVFQNGLLTDCIVEVMKNDFESYFHHELSPNDECIAFGQLALNHIEECRERQSIL